MSKATNEAEIRDLIESWAKAVRSGKLDQIGSDMSSRRSTVARV